MKALGSNFAHQRILPSVANSLYLNAKWAWEGELERRTLKSKWAVGLYFGVRRRGLLLCIGFYKYQIRFCVFFFFLIIIGFWKYKFRIFVFSNSKTKHNNFKKHTVPFLWLNVVHHSKIIIIIIIIWNLKTSSKNRCSTWKPVIHLSWRKKMLLAQHKILLPPLNKTS